VHFAVEGLANELSDDVTPAVLLDALVYVAKTNPKVKALVTTAVPTRQRPRRDTDGESRL